MNAFKYNASPPTSDDILKWPLLAYPTEYPFFSFISGLNFLFASALNFELPEPGCRPSGLYVHSEIFQNVVGARYSTSALWKRVLPMMDIVHKNI
jgi:hypothetical protein